MEQTPEQLAAAELAKAENMKLAKQAIVLFVVIVGALWVAQKIS